MKQMKLLKNLLTPFLQNFQTNLEETMRGCDFVSDSTDLLYYNLQKVGLKRSGSYIHSSEWLKNKRTTINPQNNADNCFQYALTAHEIIKALQIILKEYQKLNLLLISIIGKE